MNEINKNYIRECLAKASDNKVKQAFQLLSDSSADEDDMIEILENIYFCYLGYCEEEKIDYKEEEFLDELLTNCEEMVTRFKKIQSTVENPETAKIIKFKVTLRGYEDKFYRILEIPNFSSLAEVGYLILAAFKGIDGKVFRFDCEDLSFYSDNYLDIEKVNAAVVAFLMDFTEDQLDGLVFHYDIDDENEYVFDINIISITKNDYLDFPTPKIIDGKGYGIIEDAKPLFEMLVSKNYSALQELGLIDIGIDKAEDFDIFKYDLKLAKKHFDEMYLFITSLYEDISELTDEEDDEDYFDSFDEDE